MSEQLQIDLNGQTQFKPGDSINVAVAWELPDAPRWIELSLIWRTQGRGTTDRAAAFRHRWEATERPLDPAGAYVIDLVMPPGPLTYGGQLVGIGWGFRLDADGADDVAKRPIVLTRGGNNA
ncbi:MAG: hypothetical protein V3V20_00625 [Algisphaera sp.]